MTARSTSSQSGVTAVGFLRYLAWRARETPTAFKMAVGGCSLLYLVLHVLHVAYAGEITAAAVVILGVLFGAVIIAGEGTDLERETRRRRIRVHRRAFHLRLSRTRASAGALPWRS